jgi:addiction module HigA family antidote
MPMKNPPHPGDLIKTEIIEALGVSVSKAAEILQVRRATLSDLLHQEHEHCAIPLPFQRVLIQSQQPDGAAQFWLLQAASVHK